MTPLICVLDTNIAGFGSLRLIEGLARQGLQLRIPEVSLHEWITRAWNEYANGELSRPDARRRLFRRLKRMNAFLDPTSPIDLSGGALARRIMSDAKGLPAPTDWTERHEQLASLWQTLMGIELTDEEWRDQAALSDPFLQQLDDQLRCTARPDAVIDAELAARGPLSTEEASSAEYWNSLTTEERLPVLASHFAQGLSLDASSAPRFDAFLSALALHCVAVARGQRVLKENDGADLSVLMHLGAGRIVLTKDKKLIGLVDDSKSEQAPWLHWPYGLERLPQMPSWEPAADAIRSSFVRGPMPAGE